MLTKIDKISKILAIILLIVMIFAMVSSVVFAAPTIEPNQTAVQQTSLGNIGGQIIGVIQFVGSIIAVAMLIFIGIKYITSAPEAKAELKKTMLYYVLGAVLIASASTIAGLVYDWSQSAIK